MKPKLLRNIIFENLTSFTIVFSDNETDKSYIFYERKNKILLFIEFKSSLKKQDPYETCTILQNK